MGIMQVIKEEFSWEAAIIAYFSGKEFALDVKV